MIQVQTDIAAEMKKAMSAAQFDKAALIGAKLLRTHPKRTEIHIMTAVAEMQGSYFARAGQRLGRLLRNIDPSDRYFGPVVQNFMQFVQVGGDFKSAIKIVNKKLSSAPKQPAYREILADLIFRQETKISPGRSISANLDRAIALLEGLPDDYARLLSAQTLLARIYVHCEKTDKAFDLLEKLVARAPMDKGIRTFQASAFALSGAVENAVQASTNLINDFADIGAQPYLIIAFLRPQSMPEGAKDVLAKIAGSDKATTQEVYQACFALARIAETDNDMTTAFDWYRRGHDANRKASPIDMQAELREFELLADLARAEQSVHANTNSNVSSDVAKRDGQVTDVADQDEAGPKPIFIVGMARSGTTLSERILGAHPDVYAAGEIGDFARIVAEVLGAGKVSEQMARLDEKAVCEIRKRYLAALRAYGPDVKFVANKTPANFTRVGLIRRIFPDAPILHTHRHPLATCLSIYTTPFAIPMRFSDDLGDLADYYRGYEKLMLAFLETDQNGMFFDLSYEELVANPEQVAQDYLRHCGLDWRPECLEFYRDGKAARTASMMQVRRPINRDSIGKWQRFAPYIGPLADLGSVKSRTSSSMDEESRNEKSSGKTVAA